MLGVFNLKLPPVEFELHVNKKQVTRNNKRESGEEKITRSEGRSALAIYSKYCENFRYLKTVTDRFIWMVNYNKLLSRYSAILATIDHQ